MKAADDPVPEMKSFLEHLEDLRNTLLRSLLALGIGISVVIPFIPAILDLLKAPLVGMVPDPDRFLRSLEVAGAFTVAMRIAFWSGLLLSMPFILIFVGGFVFPALTRKEQRVIRKACALAVILFAFGVLLGYYFTLPFALRAMFVLNEWLGIAAEWTLSSYVAFTTQLLIAFGLSFELPVVLLVLGRLGIITAAQLRSGRRVAIIVILIIGAILTPPDVVSQLIMSIPLLILYEVCVWMVWGWERKAQREVDAGDVGKPVATAEDDGS